MNIRLVAFMLMLAALVSTVAAGAGVAVADGPGSVSYPGSSPTPMGNTLVIGGELYRLSYFVTRDTPLQVARHFQSKWSAQGYPVTVDGGAAQQLVVSAFDTRAGLQHSVVVRVHGERTVAFQVVRDLWTDARPSANPLPPLEGTLFSQDLSERGASPKARQRTALLDRPLETTRRELLSSLRQEGYVLQRETASSGSGQLTLQHRRGEEALVTTLSAIDSRSTALFQASTLEGARE